MARRARRRLVGLALAGGGPEGAIWEIGALRALDEVLAHLALNIPDYYSNQSRRERVAELAGYLANKLESLRPEEASAARVLRDLVRNQRIG